MKPGGSMCWSAAFDKPLEHAAAGIGAAPRRHPFGRSRVRDSGAIRRMTGEAK